MVIKLVKDGAMESFLDPDNRIGVVGATQNKDKWGYKVFMHLKNEGDEQIWHPLFESVTTIPNP